MRLGRTSAGSACSGVSGTAGSQLGGLPRGLAAAPAAATAPAPPSAAVPPSAAGAGTLGGRQPLLTGSELELSQSSKSLPTYSYLNSSPFPGVVPIQLLMCPCESWGAPSGKLEAVGLQFEHYRWRLCDVTWDSSRTVVVIKLWRTFALNINKHARQNRHQDSTERVFQTSSPRLVFLTI